jgi:hypothetical protein
MNLALYLCKLNEYSTAWCRPLTLEVRCRSFAEFCTNWPFPYFLLVSLTDFLSTHIDFTENIYRKTNWPNVKIRMVGEHSGIVADGKWWA